MPISVLIFLLIILLILIICNIFITSYVFKNTFKLEKGGNSSKKRYLGGNNEFLQVLKDNNLLNNTPEDVVKHPVNEHYKYIYGIDNIWDQKASGFILLLSRAVLNTE
jgi:glucan phosphoethanolaminetransferase (alkaline phosphatase superfamily)